ncbi:LysM peptidoglycan-binding domain-containing protein [Paraconexibacter antarcticus]|uniref:LysM peptidoglycan-binding domain-containing protein n=1 Tax=Paraconexibacter antarcticus TaxID=2949664 RepID=A0ABY5DY71_9ACTN|nr:LysM domain-containing protein [Paraconexibacter antarcticus]UTI66978.1 LysM peptidoglycan-binding domain-containing protein [Paraconexibacter antarcticus]
MAYRSPARFLAPAALIAAAIAVYALVQPTMDSGSASTTLPAVTTTKTHKVSPSSPRRAKSYVVKSGDTLSGIAETTGLSLAHIEALNPGLDANTLAVGHTLKLRQ